MTQIKYNLGDLNNNIYSTDEIKIGTWVDGKPLYRKTYVFTKTPTSSMSIKTNDLRSYFDKVINIYGTFATDSSFIPLNTYHPTSNANSMLFFVSYSSDYYFTLEARIGSGYVGKSIDFFVTIEYTKTTDAATS